MTQNQRDIDPQETQEWLSALESVLQADGSERAHFLLEAMIERASLAGMDLPFSANTPYVNTIPLAKQPPYPGDTALEHKIRSYIRWNAMAMVVRAGKDTNVGGHISSFASAATLYEVGQNHFWRGQDGSNGGDLIFFQGHSSPGMYARAYLEGRLTEEQLDNYRQEAEGKGLSSYPHPWLMPDFWQFPTVSMGLGPLMAIYQARFMRYLQSRGLIPASDRKVWAFCGDGEMDEPESRGAIGLAGRENLNNLVFVINCNLQRLDGPVRGNGKIIQELESEFRGAGWNVVKVIWGNRWDALFARDSKGVLRKRIWINMPYGVTLLRRVSHRRFTAYLPLKPGNKWNTVPYWVTNGILNNNYSVSLLKVHWAVISRRLLKSGHIVWRMNAVNGR